MIMICKLLCDIDEIHKENVELKERKWMLGMKMFLCNKDLWYLYDLGMHRKTVFCKFHLFLFFPLLYLYICMKLEIFYKNVYNRITGGILFQIHWQM